MFSTLRVGTGGALSTGKVEKVRTGCAVSTGAALSTSCSGLGVRMPKMDIEDRNMVAGVCGVFRLGRLVCVCVRVGSLYQTRVPGRTRLLCFVFFVISYKWVKEWLVLLAMQVHFRRRER